MQLLLSIIYSEASDMQRSMLLWVIVSSAQTEMKTNYVESKPDEKGRGKACNFQLK